jgi:hypothetical protein
MDTSVKAEKPKYKDASPEYKQRIDKNNKKWRDSHPDFWHQIYLKTLNDPEKMERKKESQQVYYDTHKETILAKYRAKYKMEKEAQKKEDDNFSDLFQFAEDTVLL